MALGSKPRIWRPVSSADADEAAWVWMAKSRCSGSRDLMHSKEKLSKSRQWMCISENRTGWPLWTLAFNKKKIRRELTIGPYQLWSPAQRTWSGSSKQCCLGAQFFSLAVVTLCSSFWIDFSLWNSLTFPLEMFHVHRWSHFSGFFLRKWKSHRPFFHFQLPVLFSPSWLYFS